MNDHVHPLLRDLLNGIYEMHTGKPAPEADPTTSKMEAVRSAEPVVQFDPAKLITLAKALKDEIEAQDYAMSEVADTDLYDDAMQLTDHLSTLIAHMTADLEGETLADQRAGYCGERRTEG